MRKLIPLALVIVTWFAAGILLDACSSLALPGVAEDKAGVTSNPPPTAQSAIWLWSSSRPSAVDTNTGALLHRKDDALGESVSTRDKSKQYLATWERVNQEDRLYLTWLDMVHGAPTPRLLLATIPAAGPDVYESALATTILSVDEQTAFVALTENSSGSWKTRLFNVNLAAGLVSEPVTVFDSPVDWGPNVNLALTPNGKEILVTRSTATRDAGGRIYHTHIAIVDREVQYVTRSLELAEPLRAEVVWSDVKVSPDGAAIYILENIWRDSGSFELRFSSFSHPTGELLASHRTVRDTIETGCDPRFRFVQDTQTFWNWCGSFVQFLDPETGRIAEKVPLKEDMGSTSFGDYVLSADGTTLYTVFPVPREIVVMDLASRSVLRRTKLSDRASSPTLREVVEGWLVNTAIAKSLVHPVLTLSPDESWLAFVDVRDFDTIDGIWTVETTNLKPLGHWLANQAVSGVRASLDGHSLFVLNRTANNLQVLEPRTGTELRALSHPLLESSAFVTDVLP